MNKYVLLISGVCAGAIGGYLLGRKRKVVEQPVMDETKESRSYNPVEEAYMGLVKCLTDRSDDINEVYMNVEEAVGYLGEALDEK